MARSYRIAILSDVHYACHQEQARGDDYEYRDLPNPLLRMAIKNYRWFIWMREPLHQSVLLDKFLELVGPADFVVANGDFTCDTGFIGVSDEPAYQSARECLDKLRKRFAPNFQATMGDHEVGKVSFFGGRGGMRLASWGRARGELGLDPFWRVDLGRYVLLGVASSLVALPGLEPDALASELPEWRRLREEHMADIRRGFEALEPGQKVLFFCHDPTALPFLYREDAVRKRIPQIEQTIIGHLHSNLVFWKSRLFSGIPPINCLGHTAQRLTKALSQSRLWRPFKVRLCPALAGVELLKDGGFYTAELDSEARVPARFQFHRVPR
jgi:hypothetical protein